MQKFLSGVLLPFVLAAPTFCQVPTPCPNEGETEHAKVGRSKKNDNCAVSTWSFWGKLGAGGTIVVVDASAEGAVSYSHTADSECAYEASSFSDQLAKCEGKTVTGSWCQSQAYEVIEKRWETENLDPCPDTNPATAIWAFVTDGKWPGCEELLPVEDVKHWSAQQKSCLSEVGPNTTFGVEGQYSLAEGDPRSSILTGSLESANMPLGSLVESLGADDPASHPASVTQVFHGFGSIIGELGISARCSFTRYDQLGAVSFTKQRTITGTFRNDGTYEFMCPQSAIDKESQESTAFLDQWMRDDVGIYQWTHGGRRGTATATRGGLADRLEELEYPEVRRIRDWMKKPIPHSLSRSAEYSVDDTDPDVTVLECRLKGDTPLTLSSMRTVVSKVTNNPIYLEYLNSQGMPTSRLCFSNYELVGGGIKRPLSISRQVLDPVSGRLIATWDMTLRVGSSQPTFGDPFELPVVRSGEWYIENPTL